MLWPYKRYSTANSKTKSIYGGISHNCFILLCQFERTAVYLWLQSFRQKYVAIHFMHWHKCINVHLLALFFVSSNPSSTVMYYKTSLCVIPLMQIQLSCINQPNPSSKLHWYYDYNEAISNEKLENLIFQIGLFLEWWS